MTEQISAAQSRVLANPDTFFAAVRALTGSLDAMQVRIINILLAERRPGRSHGCRMVSRRHGTRTGFARSRRPERVMVSLTASPVDTVARSLTDAASSSSHGTATTPAPITSLGLNGALMADFSKALDPDIAVGVLVRGMAEGWFTGRGLGSYLPDPSGAVEQFTAARRIINGRTARR